MTLSPGQPSENPLATYTISALANSVHYNCKKHIYLLSQKDVYKAEKQKPSDAISDANRDRGNQFELDLFKRHQAVMRDHSKSTDFKKVLQEAQPGTYLYQLKFSLPESFYTDVIRTKDAYRIRNFIPDFLYILQENKTKKIMIIDAKSAKEMSKSHQFQVASYAFCLSYLIKDIRNLEIDGLGGVWLPSDLDSPVTFRIDFLLNKIRAVYQDSLVSISKDPNPDWVLNKKCATCIFINKCKADAAGTVRSIPYMNEEKARHLREETPDIEDLAESLQSLRISQPVNKARTEYQDYVDAYNDKKPRFKGYATVLIAKETDHAIYIYLQMDARSERPFVYGLSVLDAQGIQVSQFFHAVDYQAHIEKEQETYSEFVNNFIRDLVSVLTYMHQRKSRCLLYVYSEQEKKQIQNFLYNLVVSEGKELVGVDKEYILSNAMRCLAILFRDIQLLGLPGIVHFPDMDSLLCTSSVGRFVSIEKLLEDTVAMGILAYYSLADVIPWMTDEEDTVVAALKNLDLNNFTYSIWKKPDLLTPGEHINCATEKTILARFLCLQQIMASYWQLANDYMAVHQKNLFPLICTPFQWPQIQAYKHPLLAKLVFFKQLECIQSCDQLRMDRIRDLSKLERLDDQQTFGSLVLEYVGAIETGNPYDVGLIFSVTPLLNGPHLQTRLEKLKFDTWRRYILVEDSREGIVETIQYSDLLYMSAGKYKKKGIRCVDVKSVSQDEIVLIGNRCSPQQRRWRLYERYMDFTTSQCIEALKSMDADDQISDDIMNLINDPNRWADENVMDDIDFKANNAALQLREKFSMSPSQKDISANIFKKRLQIIWGPPGSGKTEFLALFVNWYIKCFKEHPKNKSKKLMIGVTAFTREAILNLLKRIEKVQARHGFQDLFSIMYVCDGPPESLAQSSILCERWDYSITKVNQYRTQDPGRVFVVGATNWKWNKIRGKWKTFEGCSMMIMDESTQLLVSDALLAVACLKRPNGKLIVAGDHMQLGPIMKHNYSDIRTTVQDPMLYGSIQQCLMRNSKNHAIPIREFLMQKGALHDFGPNTLQLKDNWRMNEGLNQFFQHVYGPDYTARYPRIKLHLDWNQLSRDMVDHTRLPLIKSILDPLKPISLVKLKHTTEYDAIQEEGRMVQLIVAYYLSSKMKNVPRSETPIHRDPNEPNVMIVTPYHQQRIEIQRRLSQLGSRIKVDTVEKIQGQECDLVIACFTFVRSAASSYEFLRDFRRWNVALSRTRCKVIVLTVEQLLDPITEGLLSSFKHAEPTDGWSLLCLLQQWTETHNSTYDWHIDDE